MAVHTRFRGQNTPSQSSHTQPGGAPSTPGAQAEARRRLARGTLPPSAVPQAPPVVGADADAALWREPWRSKLARRIVSVPVLLILTAIDLALLPVLLVGAAVIDLARGRTALPLVRFHVAIAWTLIWHIVGCVALMLWWIAGGGFVGHRPRNWREWNRKLEGWWGHGIIRACERIYGMRMEIDGLELLSPGPVLVFSRHASIIDTMLPLRLLERYLRMHARIVKKRELVWDPAVDSISQRVPRTFVRRGSGDPEAEAARVRRLTLGMGERDGLWMFPEGTRFSPKKRARILDKLRATSPEAATRAEWLRYTLPLRPAGTNALLDACRDADVVFCAHTGLEGANRLENFIGGSLLHRTVKIKLWRVPAAEIPKDRDERADWLDGWWRRVDRWVEENQDPDLTAMLARE